MSENDAQFELKKRARRRLVGAVALAVLAAIVLPMVMDQAPKQQPAQDIQIRIPAQDAGAFTSRILPVKPGATPTPLPPAAAPEAKPGEPAKQAATQAKPETKSEPRPEQKAAPKAEQKTVPAKTEVSPASTANKSVEPQSAAMAETKPAAKKPEEAKPAAAAGNGEQWVVQLGAYKDQANVRNLTAKLKQQGYNFYTEALSSPDGSARTRVRAGPFRTKEAAEAARERIKRIGVDGVVAQK